VFDGYIDTIGNPMANHWSIRNTESTEKTPEVDITTEEDINERIGHPWRVILFNDDIHTFDEVIVQLIRATGCSSSQAEKFAWQVHTEGKASVFEGDFERCLRVQGVLREIQLVTEIEG
jgi:ATP-dependent Clp protease adapter protein ClpS